MSFLQKMPFCHFCVAGGVQMIAGEESSPFPSRYFGLPEESPKIAGEETSQLAELYLGFPAVSIRFAGDRKRGG
jgi:hypothetical protein